MPSHKVGTGEEWSAARRELLDREQAACPGCSGLATISIRLSST